MNEIWYSKNVWIFFNTYEYSFILTNRVFWLQKILCFWVWIWVWYFRQKVLSIFCYESVVFVLNSIQIKICIQYYHLIIPAVSYDIPSSISICWFFFIRALFCMFAHLGAYLLAAWTHIQINIFTYHY